MKMPDDVYASLTKFDANKHKYSGESSYVRRAAAPKGLHALVADLGLLVWLDALSEPECKSLAGEIIGSGLLRSYPIQGQTEPRRHYLLHEDADEDPTAFDDENWKQPGYTYSGNLIKLKSHAFNKHPKTFDVTKKMKKAFKVDRFEIGVNPIYYRGYSDSISKHADDNQGETLIISLVVLQDDIGEVRRVVFVEPKTPKHGQVRIVLTLSAGDLYSMDGKMQENYFHSVPKITLSQPVRERLDESDYRRLSIIFRCGRLAHVKRDTGEPCDWTPVSSRSYILGNAIPALVEGQLYRRNQIVALGAHKLQQRGVSGNVQVGCDAIISSGGGSYATYEHDDGSKLSYSAKYSHGGGAMLTSAMSNTPVRVFRATSLDNKWRATSPTNEGNRTTLHRYDGLYEIVKVFHYNESGSRIALSKVECKSPSNEVRQSMLSFEMRRVKKGTRHNSNRLSDNQFYCHCLREKTLCLPSLKCPCKCKTSVYCKRLSTHTDEQLVEHFIRHRDRSSRRRRRAAGQLPVSEATSTAWTRPKGIVLKPQSEQNAAALITTGRDASWVLVRLKYLSNLTRLHCVEDADVSSTNREFYIPESQLMCPFSEPLEPGRECLAVYPGTTTFYKAKAVGYMSMRSVKHGQQLVFDGEQEKDKSGGVARHHVLRQCIVPLPADYLRERLFFERALRVKPGKPGAIKRAASASPSIDKRSLRRTRRKQTDSRSINEF